MIKTVIFDFDGTLADTFKSTLETINSLAKKYGYKTIDPDEVEIYRTLGLKEIIKRRHLPLYRVIGILKDYNQAQLLIPSPLPFPSIPKLLNQLVKSHYDLNIITSNSVANVSLFLKTHHLTCFNHIYSDRSLFGKAKVISRFLKKFELNPDNVIYVGDELRDIEAAAKAGIRIISVTWGFNSAESFEAHSPDYLVDKPDQIAKVLEQINSNHPTSHV